MAKDPAFLFYSQDFLVGTMAMPFEERGRYITLLCYMHQNGHITEETIRLLIGSFSDILRLKFKQDTEGRFYNDRLDIEVDKRKKFTESRLLNGKKGGRPPKENLNKTDRLLVAKPKQNLIEDVNEDERKNNFLVLPLDVDLIYKKIIDHLNLTAGTKYKNDSKDAIKNIDARLKDGFIVDDFIIVIDKMYAKWKSDENMCGFIRPSTLFGNKFEGYLNSINVIREEKKEDLGKAKIAISSHDNFIKQYEQLTIEQSQ